MFTQKCREREQEQLSSAIAHVVAVPEEKAEVVGPVLIMDAEAQGKNWKLSCPFHGPYRVLKVIPSNAEVRLVDQPADEAIFVNLDRIRPCYPEQGDKVWVGPAGRRHKRKIANETSNAESTSPPSNRVGPVTRSMARRQD